MKPGNEAKPKVIWETRLSGSDYRLVEVKPGKVVAEVRRSDNAMGEAVYGPAELEGKLLERILATFATLVEKRGG